MDILAIIKARLPEGTELSVTVLEAIAKDIKKEIGETTVPKESYSKKTKELSEAEAKIATLEGAGTEIETLKQELADERKAHSETKATHAAEKEASEVDALVTAELKKAGMNEAAIPKALKLYDRKLVERKDGAITNAEKVLEHFKSEWKDFFGEVTTTGADVGTPPPPGSNSQYAGKTATELMQMANENPGKIDEIMAHIATMNKTDQKKE